MDRELCFTIALLLVAPTAFSATSLRNKLATCVGIKDDAARLTCYDHVAKGNGLTVKSHVIAGKGKWKVSTEISPIDDKENVYLTLDANKPVSGWLQRATPSLVVRCQNNKTEVYVVTGMQAATSDIGDYGTEYHEVTLRYDRDKAKNIRMTGSTDGKALFFSNAVEVAKTMMGHEKLLFEFTPFNANPAMTTFDIGGLKQSIQPLRKVCHW